MENYIIIAHPIDFVCGALKTFAKHRGKVSYRLEPVDDVIFRAQDLSPCALILHESYQHQGMTHEELIREFGCPVYYIGQTELESVDCIREPFDPAELIKKIIDDLESRP